MKRIIYLSLMLPTLLCAGCSSDSSDDDMANGKMPINFETRTADAGFEQGDQVGLYITNYSNNNPTELENSDNYINNMKMSYDGAWKPAQQMYWVNDTTRSDFYVYYPYDDAIESVYSYSFAINKDQSTEGNYKKSDFLWGKGSGIRPTKSAINVTASHIMSCLQMTLVPGDNMTQESIDALNIKASIMNVKTQANINLSNGEVSATGSIDTISPLKVGNQYKAIVVPQSVNGNTICLSLNGKTYILKRNLNLVSGEQYIFNVAIDKIEDGFGISIKDWEVVNLDETPEKLVYTVNGVSFTMVKVSGGTFLMGATSEQGSDATSWEKPAHQVTLSDYYIGQTEVTNALWDAVMGKTSSNEPLKAMEYMYWDGAQNFIAKLNQLTGKAFRLPTEAQWEFAARGGNFSKGYKYSGSNTLTDVAWCSSNSNHSIHKVGLKQPNELGLYDMSGNVWEICSDWYADYTSEHLTDPQGPLTGKYHIDRGGCWNETSKCRVSFRDDIDPNSTSYWAIGCRLALTL